MCGESSLQRTATGYTLVPLSTLYQSYIKAILKLDCTEVRSQNVKLKEGKKPILFDPDKFNIGALIKLIGVHATDNSQYSRAASSGLLYTVDTDTTAIRALMHAAGLSGCDATQEPSIALTWPSPRPQSLKEVRPSPTGGSDISASSSVEHQPPVARRAAPSRPDRQMRSS